MRILVCRPTYFEVAYVINAWMNGQVGRAERERALRQWSGLMERVARDAELLEVEPRPDCPDMCFTANAGLVAGGRALVSRFRTPERRAEEEPFGRWFEGAGFERMALGGSTEESFEGEGDALFQPGEALVWAGFGQRSTRTSHAAIARAFDVEVVSLRLVDPHFYHLDTCLLPLPGGLVAYYPAAFDAASRRSIEARIAPGRRIVVDEADARGFACNALRIGERLFMHSASAALVGALSRFGFEACSQPVDEFLKAGGGVKCLSLLLDQASIEACDEASSAPAARARAR